MHAPFCLCYILASIPGQEFQPDCETASTLLQYKKHCAGAVYCRGCAHTVDIGESSYAAVLVDDLDGDGFLQLLVATMNGNVYCLDTRAPYHPLKTWNAQVSLGEEGDGEEEEREGDDGVERVENLPP